MVSTVIEVTAGLDWLTATLPADCPTADLWVERCLSCLDTIASEGYELYERTMQGYMGISAGNCFVGSREDGHICQLSGYHANNHFDSVFRPGLHVSRIDVQVTAKYDVMPSDIARGAYADASASNLHLPISRRRKLVLITGSDGGDTTYIGAPSSEQRARIYNKEVQSEDISYRKTWRWEVVLRNDLSTQLAAECHSRYADRTEWARSMVASWFYERGVHCNWHNGNDLIALPLARTLPTDIERKLRWLEKQVKPSIKWLTDKGYGDTLAGVLGLSHPDSSP